jgi:hypothetical protein
MGLAVPDYGIVEDFREAGIPAQLNIVRWIGTLRHIGVGAKSDLEELGFSALEALRPAEERAV